MTMARKLYVLLSYDDPDCGGAADALIDQLQKDAETVRTPNRLVLNSIQVLQDGCHRDTLCGAVQNLCDVSPHDMYVISLLKGDQSQEYRSIRDLCSSVKSTPLSCQVITHVANYNDVGLIIRNLVRQIMHELTQSGATVEGN